MTTTARTFLSAMRWKYTCSSALRCPGVRAHRHAHAVRNQRQHMRGALHELLHILRALQVALDQAFVGRRQTRLAGQLLHIEAIGLRGRNASGRGVRLLQKSGVGQIGHDVANGGGAQVLAIIARQRARSNRLARGDVGLHDGGQDFAFAFADAWRCAHGLLPEDCKLLCRKYLYQRARYNPASLF